MYEQARERWCTKTAVCTAANQVRERVERKKLRKLNEAGKIVEGKELKLKKNNVGGGGALSVLRYCFPHWATVCSPQVTGSKHVSRSCI
jgi:hypothetical protein